MFDYSPGALIRETTFGDQAVDMRIPLKGSAEGMEDTKKTRDKVLRFVYVTEHTEENAADSLKETV